VQGFGRLLFGVFASAVVTGGRGDVRVTDELLAPEMSLG
jgi:hypothetical protein